MSYTIAPSTKHATAPRDALCAQAAHVLRITAQQWGMCTQQSRRVAHTVVPRQRGVASNCAQLQAWSMAA